MVQKLRRAARTARTRLPAYAFIRVVFFLSLVQPARPIVNHACRREIPGQQRVLTHPAVRGRA